MFPVSFLCTGGGMVEDYLSRTTGCRIYDRYPNISDREKWESLSDELKANVIKAGEEAVKQPWTQLLISDFTEFSKSGNRVRFEEKYFPRRRKLNNLVMAECVENKGRFIDDILDGIYLILEESTWCLPPHNSYERDAKQEKMPDITRPIIDLFDAESGAEVAFAEYLLRPVLEKFSPFISTYVNERLKERIFKPYLNEHFWWMGNGDEPMCNWTPWCTQNVLISALTRETNFFTEEERRAFLEKAAVSCDAFLKDYGDDGCCSEGALYYTHAGLCLWGCLELIDFATGGEPGAFAEIGGDGQVIVHKNDLFSGIYKEEKIRNIANYIVKMHVSGDYYINFADCSACPGHRTAREFLFGKATEDEVLASFTAKDFRKESITEKQIPDEINLFYHCLQIFSYDEMEGYPETEVLPENCFFESTGLMIARNEHFVLAAKAGNNADSHNHNDVGSFTIYKDGKPFVIDLGVGTYTQKTFSDKRYEIWTMQSQFHNLPTFVDDRSGSALEKLQLSGRTVEDAAEKSFYDPGICMQHDGAQYAAQNVKVKKACLSMDIEGAYGEAGIKKYRRSVALEDTVTVRDYYEGELTPVMSVMTYEEPKVETADPQLIRVGNIGTIRTKGVSRITIEEISVTDDRLKSAWKHEVYRILLELDKAKGNYEFEFI